MANLRDIARNMRNIIFGTFDTPSGVPVAYAEKIRAGESVPGGDDNSMEDWRTHLQQGALASQDSLRRIQSRLDQFGDYIDDTDFGAATQAQADAGYGYLLEDPGFTPSGRSFTAANEPLTIPASPRSSYRLGVRVPVGVSPEAVKVHQTRSGSLLTSYPREGQDAWDPFRSIAGTFPQYDYYHLVDAAVGTERGISGVQEGDIFSIHIHDGAEALDASGLVSAFDVLPAAADYPNGKVVVVNGVLYRRTDHEDNVLSGVAGSAEPEIDYGVYRGVVSAGFAGVELPHIGRWTHNPGSIGGAVEYITFQGGYSFIAYISKDAYETVKGGDTASGDRLTVEATDGVTTGTVTLSIGIAESNQNRVYAGFTENFARPLVNQQHENFKTVLDSTAELSFKFWVGGAKLDASQIAGLNQPGWTQQDDLSDIKVELVREQIESLRNSVDTRLDSVEDKTSRVSFDNDPTWQEVMDNDDGARFGKYFVIPAGDNADSYGALDYTGQAAQDETYNVVAAVNNSAVVWVLPNDASWSSVRLSVYRADGSLKWRINGSTSLRNMPDAKQALISNIPASPDYTARWPAVSDTEPHSLGDLRAGDVIKLEELAPGHVPVWDGLLSGALNEAIRDSIYEAATAPSEWDWHEPDSGYPSMLIGSFFTDTTHVVHNVFGDQASNDELVNAILSVIQANAEGTLRIRGTAQYYYRSPNLGSRESGLISDLQLRFGAHGHPDFETLVTINPSLADFLAVRDASGNSFPDSPSREEMFDESFTLADFRTWNLATGNILTFKFLTDQISGFAEVRLEFKALEITFTDAGGNPLFSRIHALDAALAVDSGYRARNAAGAVVSDTSTTWSYFAKGTAATDRFVVPADHRFVALAGAGGGGADDGFLGVIPVALLPVGVHGAASNGQAVLVDHTAGPMRVGITATRELLIGSNKNTVSAARITSWR